LITTRKTVISQARGFYKARNMSKLIMDEVSRLVFTGALPIGDGKTDNDTLARIVLYVAITNIADRNFFPLGQNQTRMANNLRSF
jgi:hypothetical protein